MAYLKSFVGLFMFYKSLYFRYYAMLSWQLDYLTRFNRLSWALATCGSTETESLYWSVETVARVWVIL